MEATSEAAPLLSGLGNDAVQGSVDYKGRPVPRSRSGGWRSAFFIIGVEVTERFAYYGIASNLISYLTGPLHQSTAEAATNVNVWSGAASLLPLLGAFVADSYLGRYRTILLASLLYILGLGLLTLSASLSFLRPPPCVGLTICPSPSGFQKFFFFASLYLVALAQGGHKPCVQAFGADQFDAQDPTESKSKSSFFNWWYFGICAGTTVALAVVSYIQDNVSWGLGFGIPCTVMAVGLVIFLLGTRTYRYTSAGDKNPFVSLAQVFVAAARRTFQQDPALIGGKAGELHLEGSNSRFKFLDRVIAVSSDGTDCSDKSRWNVCTESQVEDAKTVLQLVPIWATCLIYAVVFAQMSTLFTKQGSTMDRSIGSNFRVPPATLQTFISLSIVFAIPIYDRILVPAARAFTRKPSGITMLQRIGTGMFFSALSMVMAAVVEKWRLDIARESGLVDDPSVTLPMSVWWLVPQYILFGVADVFTMVGLQEFFYDQVPDGLRSVGLALYLSIFGIGSFISGFMISAIDKVTRTHGDSWFATNLNRAHLDYFYWLLAGLSLIELGFYLFFTKSYVYKTALRSSTV
ncbi:protein NRT1/ PTR FAMILY 5.10-like [Aristolochia californica]|uniref:protein NRT1/ PTR FAMILY 5.10-like n=1 Tax=Aristolochia californica TaxID=171875 RepID=UPI0035D69480